MTLWMITGNATDDGAPIYLQANGRWSRDLAEGLVLTAEDPRDEQLAAAKRAERVVCDPYLIEVRHAANRLEPASLRERIRATGPTIALISAASLGSAAASA